MARYLSLSAAGETPVRSSPAAGVMNDDRRRLAALERSLGELRSQVDDIGLADLRRSVDHLRELLLRVGELIDETLTRA